MEHEGGPEDAEVVAMLGQLRQVCALVEQFLRPEEAPSVLHASGQQEIISFELIEGTPDSDEVPLPDSPLFDSRFTDERQFNERMINIANYVLQEFDDARPHLDPALQHLLTAGTGIWSFDEATHKMQAFVSGNTPETVQALEVHSLELTGGGLNGVTFDKVQWRGAAQMAQLYIILYQGEPCLGWINTAIQHPIARECVGLFGPIKDLIDLVDGRFKDAAELDHILLDVAQRTEGFLPEEDVASLLARVREVALEAKERRALSYVTPSREEVDQFINMLQ